MVQVFNLKKQNMNSYFQILYPDFIPSWIIFEIDISSFIFYLQYDNFLPHSYHLVLFLNPSLQFHFYMLF